MLSTSFENEHLHKLQNWETFKIFDQLSCKSSHLIYLIQYRICQQQYVGKSETYFNIELNNHRKDSKNKNPILARKHFQNLNHNFQRDEKFTLIEQIANTFKTIEEIRLLLKKRENFWILKLKTLYPDGLHKELNDIKKLLHCHLPLVYVPFSLAVGT